MHILFNSHTLKIYFNLKLKMACLRSYLNCCPYTTLNFKLYENISVLFSLISVSSPAVVRDYRLQGCLVFSSQQPPPSCSALLCPVYLSCLPLASGLLPICHLVSTCSCPYSFLEKKSVYNTVNLQQLYQNGDLTLHFLYHCSVLQPLPRP